MDLYNYYQTVDNNRMYRISFNEPFDDVFDDVKITHYTGSNDDEDGANIDVIYNNRPYVLFESQIKSIEPM